jgi:NitT/TauT family transport system ATP-binding protein
VLKIVAGLVTPTSGQVAVKGTRVVGPRRDVGIVFQLPVLLGWRSVLQNIMYPVKILGLDRVTHKALAIDLIRLVGLQGFEEHHPQQLSGGMQQRVSICRELIHDPSILLIDEPFGALDALTRGDEPRAAARLGPAPQDDPVRDPQHLGSDPARRSGRGDVRRPGRIVKTVPIELPRPRRMAMERSDQFQGYEEEIRDLIFGSRLRG